MIIWYARFYWKSKHCKFADFFFIIKIVWPFERYFEYRKELNTITRAMFEEKKKMCEPHPHKLTGKVKL